MEKVKGEGSIKTHPVYSFDRASLREYYGERRLKLDQVLTKYISVYFKSGLLNTAYM